MLISLKKAPFRSGSGVFLWMAGMGTAGTPGLRSAERSASPAAAYSTGLICGGWIVT